MLKGIFGPKRDEVKGDWRKLHNEELNDLYSSLSIVWVIKFEKNQMGRVCSTDGGEERRVQGFGGETRGKETTRESQA